MGEKDLLSTFGSKRDRTNYSWGLIRDKMQILTLKEKTSSCLMEERRGLPLLPRHSPVISGVWTLIFFSCFTPELHFFQVWSLFLLFFRLWSVSRFSCNPDDFNFYCTFCQVRLWVLPCVHAWCHAKGKHTETIKTVHSLKPEVAVSPAFMRI